MTVGCDVIVCREENDWLYYEVYYAWSVWIVTFVIMMLAVIGLVIGLVVTVRTYSRHRTSTTLRTYM